MERDMRKDKNAGINLGIQCHTLNQIETSSCRIWTKGPAGGGTGTRARLEQRRHPVSLEHQSPLFGLFLSWFISPINPVTCLDFFQNTYPPSVRSPDPAY